MGRASLPKAVTARGARQVKEKQPLRRLFMDVKVVFGGGGVYSSARARDDRSGAVAHRAKQVAGEYRNHANRLDRDHSAPGTTPIRDRLNSFTEVRALVLGQYGEASADVHHLIIACATEMARKQWQWLGARNENEAHAAIISTLRTRLGLITVREMARHRLRRVCFVGVSHARARVLAGPRADAQPVGAPAGAPQWALAMLPAFHAHQGRHRGPP